jgi:hypothetical protein
MIKMNSISDRIIKWIKIGVIAVLIFSSSSMSRIYGQMQKKSVPLVQVNQIFYWSSATS